MPDENDLKGLRVLVVEDETLVAMQIEDILEELGCVVVETAMNLGQAEEALDRGGAIDLAFLDVNIAGQLVFPFAERLAERDIPIVFATGYGKAGLQTPWDDRPFLQKPYLPEEVAERIASALSG